MTIDEAIEHAEWCVENSCGECADDHRQLAEWLRELKELRQQNEKLKQACQAAWGCAHTYVICNECKNIFGDCTVENIMRECGVVIDD